MTQGGCLSAAVIALMASGGSTGDALRHLRGCDACTRRVDLLRRVVAAGADRIADTLHEVDGLMATFLTAPRQTWWRVARQPEYQRTDVSRRLLTLALDARLREPALAIDLLNAATAILGSLPTTAEQRDLSFDSWKLLSVMLRESGRYLEAERAITRAEEIALATTDPELSTATSLVLRALLCAEPDVWKPVEASAALDRAEQVFTRRDPARMYAVLTTRAFLLFRSGALADARKVFEELVSMSSGANDETRLDALSNLTGVCVEMGDASTEVENAISQLLEENTQRRRTVQVARARWLSGRLNVLRGRHHDGTDLLREAMYTIGDPDAAIRIGMDAVGALVLAGRHDAAFDLACSLATRAVALDAREPSRRRALTAEVLAYMREAARRRMLTGDLMEELSKYVDRITRRPPVDFVPPMPLDAM